MNKLAVVVCSLMLAVPVASAQSTSAGKKAIPISKKEAAERDKKLKPLIGDCTTQANRDGLKPGTNEFNRFMSGCIKG